MKISKRTKFHKHIVFWICLFIFALGLGGLISAALSLPKTQSTIKDNSKSYSKTYSNLNDGFSFEYQNTYKISEKNQVGSILIDLEKDQKMDGDGYALIEGANVRVIYKKNILLTYDYVKEDNKTYFENPEDGKIKELTVNGYNAFQVTYGYNNKLGLPGITRVYLKNKNDILVLSFIWGENITKDQYEEYQKEFDAIIKSVKFL